jgi:hypothetical protein
MLLLLMLLIPHPLHLFLAMQCVHPTFACGDWLAVEIINKCPHQRA